MKKFRVNINLWIQSLLPQQKNVGGYLQTVSELMISVVTSCNSEDVPGFSSAYILYELPSNVSLSTWTWTKQ